MLMPGTKVAPYGKIAAVGVRGGERYYMLVDRRGVVSLMPGDVLEAHYELNRQPDAR